MNIQELSNKYDIVLNSYLRFKKFDDRESLDSIDVNEYEKSLYLTRAQKDIIIELYTGRNAIRGAYEQNEELRRYLSVLNRTLNITDFENMNSLGVGDKSVKCTIPEPVLYITFESCEVTKRDPCYGKATEACIPIRREEYNIIKDNPFKNDKVWRIDHDLNVIELISKHKINAYKVSFLTYPSPIILEDISPYQIEGISIPTEATLPDILHEQIIERAVQYNIVDIYKTIPQKDN